MAQLKSTAITQSDINEYLTGQADFSFELRVLKKLTDLGLECLHSGTYDDPITGKSREFDIRAIFKGEKEYQRIHLSIECKNIRDNFPMVVHSLKRKENESYNELVVTTYPPEKKPSAFQKSAKSVRISEYSLYKKGEYVAKSADQVGRRIHDNEITSTDGGVFEKISQAINSSKDLISEAYNLNTDKLPSYYTTFICPVLIIPDNTLWQIKYQDNGEQIGVPERITHITYYYGKKWLAKAGILSINYTISHLEIVTFSEITNFVTNYLSECIELSQKFIDKTLEGS